MDVVLGKSDPGGSNVRVLVRDNGFDGQAAGGGQSGSPGTAGGNGSNGSDVSIEVADFVLERCFQTRMRQFSLSREVKLQ